MTTIAINDKLFQRYMRAVISELYYWDTKFLKRDTPQLVVRSLANNQLSVWFKVERTTINRRIFSMHKSQHKLFYAIVAKLRDVLAKLLNPVTVAKYNDSLASADSDWPAQPYTPVVKPLSAVADKTVLSDLSKKSNDKYAKVTAAIMANDKPVKQSTGFGGKAMKSLNKSHSRGVEINSVYRDSLRQTVREAGI